jgi:hypothetical protein
MSQVVGLPTSEAGSNWELGRIANWEFTKFRFWLVLKGNKPSQAASTTYFIFQECFVMKQFINVNLCFVDRKAISPGFQGLSNFDKIVGGLVWCIETCDLDVDVLLFQVISSSSFQKTSIL